MPARKQKTKESIIYQIRAIKRELSGGKCKNPYAARSKIKHLLEELTAIKNDNFLAQ